MQDSQSQPMPGSIWGDRPAWCETLSHHPCLAAHGEAVIRRQWGVKADWRGRPAGPCPPALAVQVQTGVGHSQMSPPPGSIWGDCEQLGVKADWRGRSAGSCPLVPAFQEHREVRDSQSPLLPGSTLGGCYQDRSGVCGQTGGGCTLLDHVLQRLQYRGTER